MSTVICDRKRLLMAGDRQVEIAGNKVTVEKVSLKHDEENSPLLVGFVGSVENALLCIRWICNGSDPQKRPKELEDEEASFFVLTLNLEGKIVVYGVSCVGIEVVEDEYAAVGTGSSAALAAAHMGASLAEAIKLAAEIDPYTGRGVTVVHF